MDLNQVTLPAINVRDSVDFYKKMGFTQIVDSPHYARFECPAGETTFSVHFTEQRPVDSGVKIYFEHEDLDALCESLESRGFNFEHKPVDQSWLWREAILVDPSGNTICLYWAGENRKHPPSRV
jgi:catechol 2,3-dioxygenase-like lactoylglutathione lyase family enzyme